MEYAWAHAVLQETLPADGARLVSPPQNIRLRFNEPVAPIKVVLLDGTGTAVPVSGAVSAVGNDVLLPLTERLTQGQYLVSYRVTSIDAHPVAGSFTFTVGNTPAPQLDSLTLTPRAEGLSAWFADVNRALHYLALLAAAGVALFRLSFRPPQRWARTLTKMLLLSALTGTITAVLSVGLGGLVLAGDPVGHLSTTTIWSVGGQTSLATSAGVAVLGFVTLWVSTRQGEPGLSTGLLAIGATLAIASLGFSGHAAQAPPSWLMTPSLILHAFMVALWLGSLWALFLIVGRESGALSAELLKQFSHRATALIVLLFMTASVLAWVQVKRFGALFDTPYGLLLLAKLTLVALLLSLASLNRWRLVPMLARGRPAAQRHLRISIGLELMLVVAIIAVTAALGSTPPPRSLGESDQTTQVHTQRAAQIATTSEGIELIATVVPAQTGANRVILHFTEKSRSIQPKEVTLSWSSLSAGIEPLQKTALPIDDKNYEVTEVIFVTPGRWQLRIDALIDDFTKVIFHIELPLSIH